MSNHDSIRAHHERRLRADLARLAECTAKELPASVSKLIACKFLGLTNPKTLNVWHSTGRHGIVMFKMGHRTEPCTDWLISLKLDGLSIAGEAA